MRYFLFWKKIKMTTSSSHTTAINTLGIVGGILVSGSLVPQLVKVFRTRSAGDLSSWTFAIFALGELLWCCYAGDHRDWILLTFKIISGLLAAGILLGILLYSKKT
jgi:MtN3 and saliva related transmembrane protein